jgi:plastocyanin
MSRDHMLPDSLFAARANPQWWGRYCSLGVLLLILAKGAGAAELQVKVVDVDGLPAVGVAVTMDAPRAALAAMPPPFIEVRQKNLRFLPALTVVPVGSELRFTNEDEFDHHVMGVSERTRFEFFIPASGASRKARREPARGVLSRPGVVALHCHLHASMRGQVLITSSPFHGVTDANGEVRYADVAAGSATLQVWHPLMLVSQPAEQLEIGGNTAQETTIRLKMAMPGRSR